MGAPAASVRQSPPPPAPNANPNTNDESTPRPRRTRKPFAWRALLSSTAVVAFAAGFLGSVFGSWWPALLLIGECLVVLGLAVFLQLLRVTAWVSTVAIGMLVLAVSYLMMMGAPRVGPDAQIDRPAWRVLLDAVASLLTTPPGSAPRLDLVAPAILLVGLTHAFVVVRAQLRRPGQAPGVAPLIVAPILYAAGQILTAGTADRNGLIAGAIVLLTIVSWSRMSLPTVGAAAVCAVAATLVALIQMPPGWDVRQHVTSPQIHVDQTNLLPYLSQWAAQQDTELFTAEGVVANRIAVATYTNYDGNTWSTGSEYALLGSPRRATLPDGRLTAGYQMVMRPAELPGQWLPSAGTPRTVSLPDAVQDLVGGSLARLGQDQNPLPYTVSGTIDMVDEQQLVTAGVPDQAAAAAYLGIPDLDEPLRLWVENVVANYPGRYDQAAAIEAALRTGRTVDPKGTGSSTLFSIDALTGASTGQAAGGAPAENFVSAFAVLARSIGLPTRVVVGAKTAEVAGVSEESWTVRARDMTVWPEAYFSGVGWVAFDPVPGSGKTPGQKRLEAVAAEQPEGDLDQEQDVPIAEDEGDGDALVAAGGAPSVWSTVATGGVVGGIVIAGLIVAVLVLGWLLRRRLRRRGAVGSWAVIESSARLAGVPVEPSWSSERVAAAVGSSTTPTVGAMAAAVARRAECKSFAPPSELDVPHCWKEAKQVRGALRKSVKGIRRIRWYVGRSAWLG